MRSLMAAAVAVADAVAVAPPSSLPLIRGMKRDGGAKARCSTSRSAASEEDACLDGWVDALFLLLLRELLKGKDKKEEMEKRGR